MTLVRINPSFRNETEILEHDDIISLYFGLSSETREEFECTVENGRNYCDILYNLFKLLDIQIKFKNEDSYLYQKWKEQRLLELINDEFQLADKKPTFMREDINQLSDRRSDLAIKARKQLTHFEKNYHKVPNQKLRIENYIKRNVLPVLKLHSDTLFISGYNKINQIYANFYTSVETSQDSAKFLSSSYVDISTQFLISLASIYPEISETKFTISNKKIPKRRIQQFDEPLFFHFDVEELNIKYLKYSSLIKQVFNEEITILNLQSLKLTKDEVLVISNIALSRYQNRKEIYIGITNKKDDFQDKITDNGNGVILLYNSNLNSNFIKIDPKIFLVLSNYINQIMDFEIVSSFPAFATMIKVKFENSFIQFISNFSNDIENTIEQLISLYLDPVLNNHDIILKWIEEKNEFTYNDILLGLEKYLSKSELFSLILYHLYFNYIDFNERTKNFYYQKSNRSNVQLNKLSENNLAISGLSLFYKENMIKKFEGNNLHIENDVLELSTSIDINAFSKVIDANCSCNYFEEFKSCRHIKGLLLSSIIH